MGINKLEGNLKIGWSMCKNCQIGVNYNAKTYCITAKITDNLSQCWTLASSSLKVRFKIDWYFTDAVVQSYTDSQCGVRDSNPGWLIISLQSNHSSTGSLLPLCALDTLMAGMLKSRSAYISVNPSLFLMLSSPFPRYSSEIKSMSQSFVYEQIFALIK